ncbi:MAG: hypothetical protein U0807_16305 [Candidatus Binatia bacterium]
MRWRQVVGLYAMLALLGAWYWLFERGPRPEERGAPAVRERFVPFDAAEVTEVRVTRAGRHLVARREAERWTVVAPAPAVVPSDLIAAFVAALAAADAIERVAGTEADGVAFGLGEDAVRVEIVGPPGGPLDIRLGATNPSGTAIYARRAGAPAIVLIGRNVGYYDDLLFQALPVPTVPAVERDGPVGG